MNFELDITLMRIAITVLSFVIFIGICWWAWHPGNRTRFAEAALLPLDDEPAACGMDEPRGEAS
jgi:cytochrome c oxidase cbb3-type subunit IV